MGNKSSSTSGANKSSTEVAVSQYQHGRDPNDMILRVLTWNILGLDETYLIKRTMVVCDEIESRGADIIYLQEVIPKTWDAMKKRLKSKYHFYRHESYYRYFHIIMVRKDSPVQPEGDVEIIKFTHSMQDRHLLSLPVVVFDDCRMQLLTSHLESPVEPYTNSVERKNQLKLAFDLMSHQTEKESKVCLFGGDTNLLENEIEEMGLPENFGDLWEMCGSNVHKMYTWEPSDPRRRLDRFYMCPKPSRLKPEVFELVGESLLNDLHVHPSDHLGVWVEFKLTNGESDAD